MQTNSLKIGIIGAMKSEMEAIIASVQSPRTTQISGLTFVEGRIHGTDVIVTTSGIGKVFAAICAQAMIMQFHPDLIINIGVSGSLTPNLNIGDIAIGQAVVQHDLDATPIGIPKGMITELGITRVPCNPDAVNRLEKSARELGFHNMTGIIATGDVFVQDSAQKKQIAEEFSAISCEMEGGSIGQVCLVNRTPFCVLRAISDNGDENSHHEYTMSLEMAADRATQVMDRFLEQL